MVCPGADWRSDGPQTYRSRIVFYLAGGQDWPFGVSDIALKMPPTIRPAVTFQGAAWCWRTGLHVRGTGMPLRPIDSSLP